MDTKTPDRYAIPRRRVLQFIAGGLSMSALGGCGKAAPLKPYQWSGRLLGAETSLFLFHQKEEASKAAVSELRAEMKRLEGIFALHVPGSDISRLNETGRLESAAPEMLNILDISRRLWRASDGLFDPTIQPLFDLYANYYAQPRSAGDEGPSETAVAEAKGRVGLDKVAVEKGAIYFKRSGMGISFNGIAQGFMTDKACEILLKLGFRHALVNIGEYRAIGGKPQSDGTVGPWKIGIADALSPWNLFETLEIQDLALSTSAPSGAAFDTGGTKHHLFNPKTGLSENRYLSVTTMAPSATVADGLSTVLALVPESDARAILSKFRGSRALLRPMEGEPVRIGF